MTKSPKSSAFAQARFGWLRILSQSLWDLTPKRKRQKSYTSHGASTKAKHNNPVVLPPRPYRFLGSVGQHQVNIDCLAQPIDYFLQTANWTHDYYRRSFPSYLMKLFYYSEIYTVFGTLGSVPTKVADPDAFPVVLRKRTLLWALSLGSTFALWGILFSKDSD